MTRRRMCLLGSCAVLLVAASRPDAAQVEAGWTRVIALYRQRLADAGIVGSSLFLIRGGAVVGTAIEGYQDLQTKQPVDERTIYHWASVTKTFTGVAIMQLRDRGLLGLDDPVVKYVPELRRVHNPHGDISQVTIRHLMSHSGGFRSGTWPWGGDEPWHPFEPTEWEQLVAMFPYTQVLFKPGTKYRYSNPGVVFLGRIIEILSADDYEMYVTKNILMPLEMHRTFFDRAPAHLLKHRSHSYVRDAGGIHEMPFDFDTGITVSNGGLNAPLDDMAKYLAFLIGDDRRRDVYDPVLARGSIDEMFRPQIRAVDGEGGSGSDVSAGLSCFIERHHGVQLVGHSGDQNGFISHLYIHRPSRSGYIVSFNTNTASAAGRRSTRSVDDDVRDAIVREIFANPKLSIGSRTQVP
jgi:CubicO group peptidase (beta-lactamase class C family)